MPMSGDYARTGGAFGRDLGLSRFTRPCTSLPGMRVARVLDQLGAERGLPELIVVDNGPEFAGRALESIGLRERGAPALHRSGQTSAERVHREFQRTVPGRVPERALVQELSRNSPDHGHLAG